MYTFSAFKKGNTGMKYRKLLLRRVGYLLKELQNNHIPSVEMENSDNIITLNEAVAFCTDGSKITSCLQQGFSGFGFKRVEVFKV